MTQRATRNALLLGFGIFVTLAAFSHVTCVDVGFHIRTGAHILETGRMPSVNTFAFTVPDAPWTLHQWWPGILFHLAYTAGGLTGLILVKIVLALLVMGFALWAAGYVTRWQSVWPFWAATCGVLLARSRFYERPFFVSAVLFALLVFLELRFRANRRWQWIGLPLLLAFWANTHAGVIYGVLYVLIQAGISASAWTFLQLKFGRKNGFLFAASSRGSAPPRPPAETPGSIEGDRAGHGGRGCAEPRRIENEQKAASRELLVRMIAILLSGLTIWLSLTLINPSGIRAIFSPVVYFLDPFWQALIQEFRGVTWARDRGFVVVFAALLLLQAATWRHVQWHLALPALVLGVMTFRSRRCILFFVLAAVPYAGALLHQAAPAIGRLARKRHVAYVYILWAALVGLVFVRDPAIRFGVGLYERLHPRGIYTFMKKQVPSQPIYNDMRYGAGILWWLYPDFRPFIDGRCEAYPKSFWRDTYRVAKRGDPGWQSIFERYDISGALVYTASRVAERRLPRLLHADPRWALVAFDDTTQLYLKHIPENADIIARHQYHHLWPTGPPLDPAAYASEEVRAEAERAVSVAPACRFAGLTAARCAFEAADWPRAVALYEQVLALPGSTFSPAVFSFYGHALYNAGRFHRADEVFADLAEDPGPRGADAWFMRHFIAVRRRNFKQASRFLDKAIAQAPGNAEYKERRRALRGMLGKTIQGEKSDAP